MKPLDAAHVAAVCGKHEAVVVVEEHSVYGGLASAVAEATAEYFPAPVCAVGVQDRFSRGCGSYDYLLWEHGLDEEGVKQRVRKFVARLPSMWGERRTLCPPAGPRSTRCDGSLEERRSPTPLRSA